MKAMSIALLATALASPQAFAYCTPDEANALAAQVAERVNEIIDQDPQRAAEINKELKEMPIKRTNETLEDECVAYRTRLQELDQARKQSGLPPSEAEKAR